MRRGPQRIVLLVGAVLFGAFAIVALVFARTGVSQETLSVVGGAFAYAFIAAVAVVLLMSWRNRGRRADAVARRYVAEHPAVLRSVGVPARVGDPEGDVPGGRGAAQANLAVPVTGPDGIALVDLVMARLGAGWEVLSATLVVGGDRVPLAGGASEARQDDE